MPYKYYISHLNFIKNIKILMLFSPTVSILSTIPSCTCVYMCMYVHINGLKSLYIWLFRTFIILLYCHSKPSLLLNLYPVYDLLTAINSLSSTAITGFYYDFYRYTV